MNFIVILSQYWKICQHLKQKDYSDISYKRDY